MIVNFLKSVSWACEIVLRIYLAVDKIKNWFNVLRREKDVKFKKTFFEYCYDMIINIIYAYKIMHNVLNIQQIFIESMYV